MTGIVILSYFIGLLLLLSAEPLSFELVVAAESLSSWKLATTTASIGCTSNSGGGGVVVVVVCSLDSN